MRRGHLGPRGACVSECVCVCVCVCAMCTSCYMLPSLPLTPHACRQPPPSTDTQDRRGKKKRVVSKAFISDSDEELSSEREDTTQSGREGETGEQSEVPQMMESQSGQSEDEG